MKDKIKEKAICMGVTGGVCFVLGFAFGDIGAIGVGFGCIFPFLYFLNKLKA